MSSPSSTRLERALELFVSHEQEGGDWQALLARHPELADLLRSFADDATTPAAGDGAVIGDFRLLREVGRGGVGAVHEARQQSLDRRVALKVLHPAFTANPAALVRFRREAHTLARLDHPGIVRVLAVGEDDGRHWLAMEFVDGESLAAVLDRQRAAGGHRGESLRRMVETIAHVAAALQHAHAADIVHRDVKPSNILLRADGTAVLGDFGLARDAEAPSLTQTGVVAGTPHYMAPEQVMGRAADCDPRTDVWALGATLYECLTLRRAFDGQNTQEVLQAILLRDPTDPRRQQRGLPMDLAAITLKALEKVPELRYQTAQALADDLQAFLEFRPVAARPPSRTRRLLRLARRQPMVAALLLLGLVSGLLGTALLWQLPTLRAAAEQRTETDYEGALLAGLLARTGKDAEVCYTHFRRAIALRPDRSEALAGYCLALLHFAGPAAALAELDGRAGDTAAEGELGRCRALLLRRLQRPADAAALERRLGPPTTPMDLWLAAVPLLDDTDNREALREASRMLSLAVRIAPHPRLLLHLQWAVLQTSLDDPEQRREAAAALVKLWPEHPMALYIAGTNLLRLDPEQALHHLRRALQLGLDDPLGRFNLGIAEANSGQRAAAVETLEAAFAHPGLTDAQRLRLLGILYQLGGDEACGRICEVWIQRTPDNLAARRSMGRYASLHDDHARALDLLRGCVAEAPQDRELREDLAFALLNAGNPAAARELLVSLAAEQPGHERTHMLLLDANDALQDKAAATGERQRWAEARATDAQAWQELALDLLESPGTEAAERALAAAEQADYLAGGKDKENLALRARALDRLGRPDEAARLRSRATALPKTSTAR